MGDRRGETYEDRNYQDQVEAEALYELLERDVVPTFYDRGADRVPRKWVNRMKASIGTLSRFVNTHRMVSNYVERCYIPNHEHLRALADNNGPAVVRWRQPCSVSVMNGEM